MSRILCVLLVLSSCATISTAGMTDACKSSYNACLNSCPEAPRQGAVSAGGPNVVDPQLDPGIASCTNDCNQRARKCK